jgi:putative transposase
MPALSDEQWELIEPLIPRSTRPGGRPRIHSYRHLMDAVLYASRTGTRWHDLPSCYPPWQTVNAYATAWRRAGVLDRVGEILDDPAAHPGW